MATFVLIHGGGGTAWSWRNFAPGIMSADGVVESSGAWAFSHTEEKIIERSIMDWKLEVATIPVSDVERARDFYHEKLGFEVDIDEPVSEDVRLVQLTPPGSSCSIHLSAPGMGMETGSLSGLFLVVTDVRKARAELVERGVEVGDFRVFDDGTYRTAREGENLDYVGCVFLDDPDGNGWCIQQIPARD